MLAAASLIDVLVGLDEARREEEPCAPALAVSVAASGIIARQLDGGLEADVFLSANAEWMDHAEHRGTIDPSTRRVVFANRLVLIAPVRDATASARRDDAGEPTRAVGDALDRLARGDRLAIANPATTPSGAYARAGFEQLGLWDRVAPRSLNLSNVRHCLAAVARGDAPLGCVYRTDAQHEPRVVVMYEFPQRVGYVGAVCTAARQPGEAARWLEWLGSSSAARGGLAEQGFDTSGDE